MGTPDLSFTELTDLLGISKSKLSHHLDVLQGSALVKNFSKAEPKSRFDSFYSLSSFGQAFVAALSASVEPVRQGLPSLGTDAVMNTSATTLSVAETIASKPQEVIVFGRAPPSPGPDAVFFDEERRIVMLVNAKWKSSDDVAADDRRKMLTSMYSQYYNDVWKRSRSYGEQTISPLRVDRTPSQKTSALS